MKLLIYANVTSRKPEATANGTAMSWPEFTAGDKIKLGVRFTEQVEGSRVERMLGVKAARLSLGLVDSDPAGGTWALQVGSGASTANNTTPPLPPNIYPTALAATLNALPAVTGNLSPATVEQRGASYIITFGDGAQTALSVPRNDLSPTSFARIRQSESAGVYQTELRLLQAPLASATTYSRELPEAPSVATVQEGYTDPSNTYFAPEIQRVTVPALFRGTWQLRYGQYQKTRILTTEETEESLKEAIETMLAPQDFKVTVAQSSGTDFLVVFDGEQCLGADLPEMAAAVFDAPEGDVTLTLDLNTREVFAALAETKLRQDCILELEADILDDGEDPEDPDAAFTTVTLFQSPVKLRSELQWDALATAATVDWLRPPTGRTYTPFTADQILTGQQQAFSSVIGDGEATEFTIDHNLGSDLCQVVVRENQTPGRLLAPDEYVASFDSDDSLTLVFPSAPAASALAVFVVAVGPASVFQSHTHTQAQVVGLVDLLDDLGSRVQTLESVLPRTGPGATTTQPSGIEIELPQTKEVLFYKGDASAAFTDKGINAAALGRPPMMFPAVHDATITDWSAAPLPAAAADTVWQNTSGGTIEMGRGIYGGRVLDDGFFASDGRALYAAARSGASTSYFPQGFDRELWRIFVNDKMLRLNRTLDVQFGLALQLVAATSNAQWLLVIEHGTAPSQSTPATTASNLENIEWDADPLLSQRIILTQNRQTHSFGARIKRSLVSSVDTITADALSYGVWEGADALAPSGANFALRARLIRFDTENALASDARGWITYEITAPTGGEDGATAKAVII